MSWIGWLSRPRKTAPNTLQTAAPLSPSLQTHSLSHSQASTPHIPAKSAPLTQAADSPTKSPSAPLLSHVLRDDWMNDTAPAGTTPTGDESGDVNDKQLSEKELTQMKEENERLKSILQQIQRIPNSSPSSSSSSSTAKSSVTSPYSFQHVGHIPGGNGFLLSIPSLNSHSSAGSLKTATASTLTHASALPSPPSYESVQQEKNDAVVCHGAHSTVLVKQLKEESDKENAVALLDLNEVDWWVMVNGTEGKDKDSTPKDSSTTSVELDDDDCVHREAGLRIVKSHLAFDNEGYVLIDEDDFIHALSDFISQSIARQYPEAEKIPSQELQKILRQAFSPIKQPSTLGKAYQWAQFLYQSYSWGSCAWSLYREPFYVKLVLRGAMKAAQWLLVLVI